MGRISRQVMYMEMARVASRRSTCHRLNVGALVTYHNSPVSVGWNGAEAGAPHCAGNKCPGVVPGACPAIHAEDNALKKAADLVERGESVDLYVTHSPCERCLQIIMGGGIQVGRLFFEVPYRKADHLDVLKRRYRGPLFGIPRRTAVYEVTPAGYIVDYFSRQVVELP